MPKYRKKPVVIEAELYEEGMEDGFNFYDYDGNYLGYIPKDELKHHDMSGRERVPVIETLEGKMEIGDGYYIIKGVKGERYACEPDIFKMTYEPVDE
ncbi:hypothetical protein [Bacillus smithii]|uniref:hypothetical protein n=1 Tax=Bacillus smithii TaxID=1479 RepID=UPI003D1A30F0